MSALYEIQEDILSCIDLKTGEIIDVERLHGLQMERRQKIRNIACWIKNLLADARAYEEEEKTFASRKMAAKNKADRLKQYLSDCLHGEKIQDKEFSIGWRKSQRIHIDEGAAIPPAYLIPVPDKVDKQGLKDALRQGVLLPRITLMEYNNIQIQ
ncbi:siphovirus Gp157 family protein [uncultured Selenomonas sp.]|uniref:siphovirus Gp157 family protein n=1 Tax=uncultured Selenomonas sp. TaxID=159275 RepID=UPI0028E3D12C|nr:siphovirus Gp157 family protein [uncultured Selenomonas sp.]